MPEIEPTRGRWEQLTRSLSAKLNLMLVGAMLMIFALLGYLNVRLHRQHLEQAVLVSAERVSDVIRRSTTEYMLRNDQPGLYHAIKTMADEPGMVKIRIFDREGRIRYTTDTAEQNQVVDKTAEACYGCHTQSQPLTRLNRPDRFRIYRRPDKTRVLGIITPIENQPSCSNATCHAHSADQQVLGVIDTNLSLAQTDVQLAESSQQMALYTGLALLLIVALSGFFVWRIVDRPVKTLHRATEHLAAGELGYQIEVPTNDELGGLARSFNDLSHRLKAAQDENNAWTHTLEERVDEKTRELKAAHEHALRTEKMASIGKMAAVLAHEINNPLSGILTYAKLLRKWISREDGGRGRQQEICDSLDLIASESRRCGDLVKNLLTYSRAAPIHLQPTNLNQVADRALRLLQHQMDLGGVQCEVALDSDLPPTICDAAQIEQVIITLMTNALDAMPQGGTLWLSTSFLPDQDSAQLVVRDNGEGIRPDILPHIFEPFLTTKETGRGVGLGLAVAHSIVERHSGKISVQSQFGLGTTFTLTLPCDTEASPAATDAGGACATAANERT